MIIRQIRAIAIAVVCAITIIAVTPAAIAAPFDGEWNFLITTKDHCGNSQWRFVIIDGQLSHRGLMFVGGFPARVAGQVSPAGQVTINLVAGTRVATGTGTLANRQGNGKWDGRGPSGTCAGIWKAIRQS